MAKSKKKKTKFFVYFILIIAIIFCGVLYGHFRKKSSLDDNKPVTDITVPSPDKDTLVTDVAPDDTPAKEQVLSCKFEGKIDNSSFEVTELSTNAQGETADGRLLQLRVENDSVRALVEELKTGQKITVEYHYNSDSQLVADKIFSD